MWINILMMVCASYLSVWQVSAHGTMVLPINWFDTKTWIWTPNGYIKDYLGMKSRMFCQTGCSLPTDKICQTDVEPCDGYKFRWAPGCSCMWFQNNTFIEKPTLFDPKLRTYQKDEQQQKMLHHPWRAPGFALVDSPCGVVGGNYRGCVGGCHHDSGGFAGGSKAERVDFGYDFKVTNWTRGHVIEAAWGIRANHGGGYSYRLCKLPEQGRIALTEECFQQIPLKFVGDVQWIQYGEDKSTRIEFPAVRVSTGTFPKGSQWTKNPIPACAEFEGGFRDPKPFCSNGTQFPPPKPWLCGWGVSINRDLKDFPWSIVDKLHVPKDLAPGEYVLSFRWDCEQTPQVWNTCASIHLD